MSERKRQWEVREALKTINEAISEAIRKFSDKYIVPVKLVAEYVRHLTQIKMRKE